MKAGFIGLGIFILLTAGTAFYFGFLDNALNATVGKQRVNIERTNYEQSQSYVEGVQNDLSKMKLEYDQSTDATAKKAILNYINQHYGSFDANKITDSALQSFLLQSRGE